MRMTTPEALVLEQWLPDSAVITDLKNVLYSNSPAFVELGTIKILIPHDCEFELVSKAFIEQRYEVGFGNCFRAIVAIGGVSRLEFGGILAKYCFSTLWYNLERQLITADFSNDFFG